MKPGTKRTPTLLRIINGNPTEKPLNEDEPMPEGDLTDPPGWFTEDQRADWFEALASAPAGLLRRLDKSVLVVWVVAQDMHRQASEAMQLQGITSANEKGVESQSPYSIIQTKNALIMIRAAAELGFSPSSRTGISAPKEKGNAFANNGKRAARAQGKSAKEGAAED